MATGGQEKAGYSLVNVRNLELQNTNFIPDNDDPWYHPLYQGIVACRDNIIVIDRYQVQLHRLQDGKLLCTHRLESTPRAICVINDMEIAVILDKGQIQIMAVESRDKMATITSTRNLQVQGGFHIYDGVVKFQENLVVCGVKEKTICWCVLSLNDGRVGAIHQICKVSEHKGDIFSLISEYNSYLVTKDNMIYISCFAGDNSRDNGVYGFDILNPSQPKYTYKHEDLYVPGPIAINQDGFIFVCNFSFYSCIIQLTSECQHVSIYRQGIPQNLTAIFWDQTHLYVTCNSSSNVSVMTIFEPVYSGTKQKAMMHTQEGVPVGCVRIKNIFFKKDDVLGMGCQGTIVYRGKFDERDVAVKRLLKDNFSLANREMELLRDADQHPNVIRYFCTEEDSNFLFIALELCEGTLQDYVEDKFQNIINIEPIDLLQQVLSGLAHLHSLVIVHRDLKPHNILISKPSAQGEVRAMISDFGFSKKLQPGELSFSSKSDVLGTLGWTAPEMLERDHKRVETKTKKRLTVAVDIFSAGCLMYYVLTKGLHPFGDDNNRILSNIQDGKYNLDTLPITSDGYIAKDIIHRMLSNEPEKRPTAKAVLNHPLFWNKEKKLMFIQQKMNSVAEISSGTSDLTAPKECQHSLRRRALPPGKKYHAFFSYSSSDIQWVKETVKRLEQDGFVCCEYERDNSPGTPLLTFAENSIKDAYKTVVVITREALESGFVNLEIDMAFVQGFDENRNCVVPVLLKVCEVPIRLRALNYVDAHDPSQRDIWWPKLLMELQTQGDDKIPEMPESNEGKQPVSVETSAQLEQGDGKEDSIQQ